MPSRLLHLALLLVALPGLALAEVAVPVSSAELIADGEDAGGSSVFAEFDGRSVELLAESPGRFDVLLLHANADHPAAAPQRVDAPTGQAFLPDRLYFSGDGRWLFAGLDGAAQGWLVIGPDGAAPQALTAASVRLDGERWVLLDADHPLAARLSGLPARAAWRSAAWPYHHAAVDGAVEHVQAVLVRMQGEYVDAAEREALRTLLAQPPRPLALEALAGAWRVRSLQGDPGALFVYPWFRAEVSIDGEQVLLRKTSGSQRRSGRLYPHGDGLSAVFLGGRTVNDDPELGYSRARGATSPEESDSIGRLHALDAAHLVLLLDADPEAGFEVYELRR